MEELRRRNLTMARETNELVGRHEFEEVTDRKGLVNKMRRGMQAELEVVRRDLEVRRNK
jgi:hypothetical protein